MIRRKGKIISEFHVIEVLFKDEGILVQSLKEMGYKPDIYEKAINLRGYQGDKREQKAHIVVSRKQVGRASNDIGFERKKTGGFVLHASAYDLAWRTGKKIKQLNRTYTENKLKKTINSISNYNIISRKERKDGKIEIHLRVTN